MEIINRHFRIRFVVVIFLILILALSISSAFFYYHTNKDLGETYKNKIYTITQFKTTIISATILIFIPPVIVAAIFIIISIVLYTHRIVGPLVRIRAITQQISEGNLDVFIKFREKDAIKPLADALNNLIARFKEKDSGLSEVIEDMRKDADILYQSIEKGDSAATADIKKELLKKNGEISNIISGIKL